MGRGEIDRQTHRWADQFGDCSPGSGVEEAVRTKGSGKGRDHRLELRQRSPHLLFCLETVSPCVVGHGKEKLSFIRNREAIGPAGGYWVDRAGHASCGDLGKGPRLWASLPGLHRGDAPASQFPGEDKELRASPGPFLVHFSLSRDR